MTTAACTSVASTQSPGSLKKSHSRSKVGQRTTGDEESRLDVLGWAEGKYDLLAAKPRRRGVKWRDIMHFKHCTYVTNLPHFIMP